ncbi:Rha family phage regulatory protein [Robbsia andropogonis]|uniref:Rha family transcriptional regulator n=1 Tax=Robbsia andropogonis TaxID=28092 RepID=UPI003D1A7BDD
MRKTTPNKKGRTPHESATPTTGVNHSVSVELVHLRRGVAVTDSLTIAAEFARAHKNVLQSLDSLIADGTINGLDFELVEYIDAKGEKRRMIELTERAALIAMPFIGGRNSRIGHARLVDAFLAMRKALNDAQPSTDRLQARRDAASNYSAVSEILAMRREADGKATLPHHFANEARLINYALVGQFKSLDRDSLSASELRILNRLEIRDTALIGMGKPYDERKAMLVLYAAQLRATGSARLMGGVQ